MARLALPDREIDALVAKGDALVRAGLTKKGQATLGVVPSPRSGRRTGLYNPQQRRGGSPRAIGISGTVYLSGKIGLDPATNQLVEGGTEAHTKRVMENLGAVLKEAGLLDLAELTKVHGIDGVYFPAGDVPPARSTVQVAALPRGARIEIDFLAVR